MTIKDRIKRFIEYLRIETRAFEVNCELSNGFVNNIGHSIREKSLKQIQTAYPQLNRNWLITGEGEMIIGPKNTQKAVSIENTSIHGSQGTIELMLREIIAEKDKRIALLEEKVKGLETQLATKSTRHDQPNKPKTIQE